jgi:Uma2 family endonuclease
MAARPSVDPRARRRSREHALPAPDERLVMPETRHEVIDGRIVYVPPSDIPHGSRHSKVSALLEAYVRSGYDVVSDVLTRTSQRDDLAPDVSVVPLGKDAKTGGRRLEELAFEVVSTQRLSLAAKRAAALAGRGVRRVFAIDVKRKRALEWSRETHAWKMLPARGVLRDRALVLPLPFDALVHMAKSDDAVARALLAKNNPVIDAAIREGRAEADAKGRAEGEAKGRAEGEAKGRAEGEAKGRAEGEAKGRAEGEAEGATKGKADALLKLLRARALRVSSRDRARISSCEDGRRLDRWIRRAVSARTVRDVLGE